MLQENKPSIQLYISAKIPKEAVVIKNILTKYPRIGRKLTVPKQQSRPETTIPITERRRKMQDRARIIYAQVSLSSGTSGPSRSKNPDMISLNLL